MLVPGPGLGPILNLGVGHQFGRIEKSELNHHPEAASHHLLDFGHADQLLLKGLGDGVLVDAVEELVDPHLDRARRRRR